MIITKKLSGVCAKDVTVIINDGIVNGCTFTGGCDGQSKALNALVAGMTCEWVVKRLRDLHCGRKKTSCAAELAKLIEEAIIND